MHSLVREPLLHFLLLGIALLVAYQEIGNNVVTDDTRTIIVDRDSVLNFLQYRASNFDRSYFNPVIDSLQKPELQRIVNEYVREEALYREAKALQLDRNDHVERLRLIQQLELITHGIAETQVSLTEQDARRYYDAHKQEYWVDSNITFSHVFFSRHRHGSDKAKNLARSELQNLIRNKVSFEQAVSHGERFLYHVNYVKSDPEEVASHFGHTMQKLLFSLPVSQRWDGPFESSHGFHLVMLIGSEAGNHPPFEEIRDRVKQDQNRAVTRRIFEQSLQSIVKTYNVRVIGKEFGVLQDRKQSVQRTRTN